MPRPKPAEPRKMVTFRLSAPAAQKLTDLAAATGKSKAATIEALLAGAPLFQRYGFGCMIGGRLTSHDTEPVHADRDFGERHVELFYRERG